MNRLLILRWRPGDFEMGRICRARWEALAGDRCWERLIDRRGVLSFFTTAAGAPSPLRLANENGAIFGFAFERSRPGAGPIDSIDADQQRMLVENGGERVLSDYWGLSFAVLHDRFSDELSIVRDGMGQGPLFVGPLERAWVVFSHVEDYLVLTDAQPDLAFLSAFLAYPRLVCPRTAIQHVREVMAGERLRLGRDATPRFEPLWRPNEGRLPPIQSSFEARAYDLRETLLAVGRSWAKACPKIVHRLSGGFDSTLALGMLAQTADAELVALNEFSPLAPEGDERRSARTAATAAGVRLIEVEMRPEHVDYARLLAFAPSAKPSRAEMSAIDPTISAVLADIAPNAMLTSGQGGDQIFHRARTPITAADAWRDGCSLPALMKIMTDTARLARRPITDVGAAVLRHGLLARSYSPAGTLRSMRTLDLGEGAEQASELVRTHPWYADMMHASPARALRLTHIADLAYYHQPFGLALAHFCAPVLASQPVVELCLATPPYMMVWGGAERALARYAAAGLIPQQVRERTDKGDTTRYHVAIAIRQLPFVRAMLRQGRLIESGLIAPQALYALLSRSTHVTASEMVAISSALLVELWLRRFELVRDIGQRKRQDVVQGTRPTAPPNVSDPL